MSEKNSVSIPHIHNFLSGLPYPSTHKEIIEYARNKGANTGILDVLMKLPDQEFKNESEIMSNLKIEK